MQGMSGNIEETPCDAVLNVQVVVEAKRLREVEVRAKC